MSELERRSPGSQETSGPTTGTPLTGNEQVDAVLRSLGRLDGLPVDEHVAVFESAHAGLREALDGRDDQVRAPAPRG